nr:tRNA pseudouridine(55) synthase TruB [uncultured Dethiosulfovibrio sp.]
MSSKASRSCDGFLLLDKPAGARSTDCVSAVKRALGRGHKVGHAGTLDSTAKGLLVILVGKATRLCSYVMDLPKKYEGTVVLGKVTSTDDESGDILSEMEVQQLSMETVDSVVPSFLGIRMQRPPSISAIKVDGKRAHFVSRNTGLVTLPSRPIFVSSLSIGKIDLELGEIDIKVSCHKGTYIRSIARDIGDALGWGGYLKNLARDSVGPFNRSEGLSLDEVSKLSSYDLLDRITSVNSLCQFYPSYRLPDSMIDGVKNGLGVPISELTVTSRGFTGGGRNVIAIGDGLFSFCRLDISGGKGMLIPETNIFLDGGEIH